MDNMLLYWTKRTVIMKAGTILYVYTFRTKMLFTDSTEKEKQDEKKTSKIKKKLLAWL